MNEDWLREPALWASLTFFLSIVVAVAGFRKVNAQLQQMACWNMQRAVIDHNWHLLGIWDDTDFPAVLPSWETLTKRGFTWRVLLCNHLNLLQAAYDDDVARGRKRGLSDHWVAMSGYWFKSMRAAQQVGADHEGLGILYGLLDEGAYPAPFIEHLEQRGVLPSRTQRATAST